MLAGLLLSLSSLLSFTQLMLGNPLPFAFKYTAGNLLSLGATGFLVGPARQARGMLAPSRRVASLVYGASLVSTLLSTLLLRRALGVSVRVRVSLVSTPLLRRDMHDIDEGCSAHADDW